jgi:hypothetical protein
LEETEETVLPSLSVRSLTQCAVEVAVVAVSRGLQGRERVQTEAVREDISLVVLVLSSLEAMQRQTLEAVVVVQPLTRV